MAYVKVLFNYVPKFRDSLVSLDFQISQFYIDLVLAHNPIVNIVHCNELTVWQASVSFISKAIFNFFISVHTMNNSTGKIWGIIMGSRTQNCRKNKSMPCIYGSMFFKAIVRFFIFNSPVRLMIPGKFFEGIRIFLTPI